MTAQSPTVPEGPIVGRGQFSPLFDVVRLFVNFLQWRFSLAPQGSYRYVDTSVGPEESDTEIFIGSDSPIQTSVVGKRPAITVLRSQAAFAGLGIGDRAFLDLATGAKVRMDMIPTNIMVNCLSREQVEAEGLAWFVRKEISALRDDICKASNGLVMYTGSKMMLSPPSPAGSLIDTVDTDWTVVVVAIPTYLHIQDTALPLNKPIVGKINTTMTTTPAIPPDRPVAVSPLQGSAVQQPNQTPTDRDAAVGAGPLPQTGPDEAQSSEPLTVEIQTR